MFSQYVYFAGSRHGADLQGGSTRLVPQEACMSFVFHRHTYQPIHLYFFDFTPEGAQIGLE
jgi:hypothetical protein